MRTTKARRGSKRTPESMRMLRRTSGKKGEKKDGMATWWCKPGSEREELKFCVTEGGSGEARLGKKEAEKMKKDNYSLMDSLQLTQKKLEQVRGESEEKNVVIESLGEAAKAKTHGKMGQKLGPREVTRRPRYKSWAQTYFRSFAQVLYSLVLDFANLKISELSFD